MLGLGVPELLLILVVVLIFFGADKIPQLAKSLGKGMSEFRKAQQDLRDEFTQEESKSTATTGNGGTTPTPYLAICPACQGKTSRDSVFCSQCGHRMPAPPICTNCQRTYLPDEKFCPGCGQSRPS